jgi:putative chitinase
MNDPAFFAQVRNSLFGGTMSQSQVDGINRLLDVWSRHYSADPLPFLAYDLATSFHETARTMQPITERGPVAYFNKYEPGTPLGKALGNKVAGDGYRFRGEGDVQNTGRANAVNATRRLNAVFGLGIDLVATPEKRGDPMISAHSLFLGNREGWWTGKKLGDYMAGGKPDYIGMRRVINGTDRAELIAGYAAHFEIALKAAA